MSLLPGSGLDIPGGIGSIPKEAAEKITGRVQCIGHRAQRGGLKLGLVTVTTPVTIKLELEARVCALIAIIACELNQCHG